MQKIPIDKTLNPKSGQKFIDVFGSSTIGYVGFEDQAYLYFANSLCTLLCFFLSNVVANVEILMLIKHSCLSTSFRYQTEMSILFANDSPLFCQKKKMVLE